jgi:putative transposase
MTARNCAGGRWMDWPMITAYSCISSTRSSGKQRPTLFSDPPTPIQNAYIESFNGRYREERLNQHWFTTIFEAREIIEDWRIDYNTERPHSSLKYQTPEEFAATRPVDKAQWAQPLELPDGSAPAPITHAANDGKQMRNRLDLRMALKKGAGHARSAFC